VIKHVVDKFIMELEVQLEKSKVHLNVDKSAREWFAHHGYDEKMGARPMARIIQEQLKRPLADELLFGRLIGGGKVDVSTKKGQITINIEEDIKA
jgi:ATP-dependent Clp protease ATP-binding subunit ClpA